MVTRSVECSPLLHLMQLCELGPGWPLRGAGREASPGAALSPNCRREPVGGVAGAKRMPRSIGEHILADTDSDFLRYAVLAQEFHRVLIEGEGPPAGGTLGRGRQKTTVVLDELLHHGELGALEIDVAPAQPAPFTPAQAAQRHHPPEQAPLFRRRVVEEGVQLLGGPDTDGRPSPVAVQVTRSGVQITG
jgi:hypothetical protein